MRTQFKPPARLGSHSAGKTFGNAALYSGTTRRAWSAAGRPSM